MQATPTSSTFKLTTTASTTATNLHNLDTTTTGNNNIKVTKSTKINRNTTLNNNESCAASKEIEEISKKISEHADAIYRTWKCRGLAPTEILDIYTNVVEHNVTTEAADIFGGSVEAAAAVVGTTEGLQKLVNQFVIKDKEQRGVKPSTVTSSTAIYGTGVNLNKSQRTEAITTETKIMPENIGSNKMTQKTGNSNHSIGVGGNLKQSTSKTTTTTATAATATGIQQKPSTTKTTTSTSSAILLKSSNSNENSSVKKLAKSAGVTTTKTASSTALSSSSTALSSSPSSLATSLKNNACVKNVNSAQQQHNNNKPLSVTTTQTPTSTASTTPTTTKTPTTKRKGNSAPTLDINLNLDLGFDPLQLDVNSLSQLQTQNLLKIKELLHDNSTTAAATTTTTKTTTTTTQQPKKTITTTTATKTSNKIKRAISPAKLQESTTVTDSPIVTKTKLSKVVNENDQINNNNNNVSVKKIAKNANNNSISDKSNSNSKLNNGNDCIVGAVDAINDAVISKLINTNDRLTSGKTTTTKAKSNATTKSIISKTTKTPAIITPMPTTTADTAVAAAAAAAAAAMPISANVVGSVKTVDHQSIKSGGNSTNGSFTKNQPQAAALNDNVGQQLTIQKPTTPTIKKVIAKESKINDSEAKININNSNNSNSNNNNNVKVVNSSSSTVKPHKSVKSTSSPKATTQTVVASSKTANPMEIAPESKDKINSNNNSNGNGNDNSNNNGSDNSSSSNNMPAPTKLSSGRAALGASQDKLNRPFLTRGSVAERVLMFEKCPDVRNSYLNIKRPDLDVLPKSLRKVSVKLHSTPPGNQKTEQNSLQKEIRTTRSVYIPRFYFPHGKPQPQIAQERTIRGILSAFDSFPNNQVTKDELPQILKICGLPFYWRMPVVVFCQQHNSGLVERSRFLEFWKQMNIYCHDSASRFVYIHSRGQRFRSYIAPEDLVPLVQDVVDTHPGLAFLKEATEFHSRYVHTVIARIFYSVNRSWSGKITISELKKSDLLEIIQLLEEEDDINQIMAFFSYEHFYVIYCKFWELDKDHDLLINQDDLARHSDHALSTRIVERIFSGCVTRNDNKKHPNDEPKMSYTDFVWFLLSEEDKRTPTAIEYWFRCMDLDGDGFLSMYELEYFYEEQQQRMESIGIETLPFEDCLCQMLDMIKPQNRDAISLGDLKRCRMTQVFFDTFFNLEKYLDHEQRDPFATQRDEYSSDWDRFAAHEYELLISEENG